jgi:membrane associated rhomboid family serine protease
MSYNNQYRPNSFGNLPVVTKNIIIINVILYIATVLLIQTKNINLTDYLGLHYYLAPEFKPHQFITYIFMHDSHNFSHILFNMIGVYIFGQVLENVWGAKRYLIFYIATGLGAAIAQYIILHFELQETLGKLNLEIENFKTDPKYVTQLIEYKSMLLKNSVIVGASGSLFGLLGAFGLLFPNTLLYLYFFIPVKAKWIVIGYGAFELFSGLSNNPGDNVAHFAHLGGLAVGILLVLIWRKNRQQFY